jgi:hypothetical protein
MHAIDWLGNHLFEHESFPDVEKVIASLGDGMESEADRREAVNRALLDLIEKAPYESFLLPAVVDFCDRVARAALLFNYAFADFELWLNGRSGLGAEANECLRGRIVGKYLPRDEYQAYFPIGMGRYYAGSHFVSAHNPPDFDTTVASFWGWVDAFAARVSKNVHWWNLPGGAAPAQTTSLLEELIGSPLFSVIPADRTELCVTARDLLRQKGLEKTSGEIPLSSLDLDRHDRLVVLTDNYGYYRGCFRSCDVEPFHLAALLLRNVWRWLEDRVQAGLLQLSATLESGSSTAVQSIQEALQTCFNQTEVIAELPTGHAALLESILCNFFALEKGLTSRYEDLLVRLHALSVADFDTPRTLLQAAGVEAVAALQEAWQEPLAAFRRYCDRLDVAVALKYRVLEQSLEFVTADADLAQIREQLISHHLIPVVAPTRGGDFLPIGVISAVDLQRKSLSTATLRDFCNREEVKIPVHIEVISIIDHHRASLQTAAAPTVLLGDVQSCNVLVAEQAFALNDRYSLGRIEATAGQPDHPRLAHRLTQRRLAAASRGPYFVHPTREAAEYLSFLYAILDDTDLLSRVSTRDVLCIASLLNRLKSLAAGEEVECVSFDDLPRGPTFARLAARRLLENEDMYQFYREIYRQAEAQVERQLACCLEGLPSEIFLDAKEQKGCARVGQTKVFANNFPSLHAGMDRLRQLWVDQAIELHRHQPQLQLHLHMITTLSGAEELHTGKSEGYRHSDELWIWVPSQEEGWTKLTAYLRGFGAAPEITGQEVRVELWGPRMEQLQPLFASHFSPEKIFYGGTAGLAQPIAVLLFGPTTISSRKLSITPYIPPASDN